MKASVVGVIFARGGSKGVPGKNIRQLAGKPLIAYAIETALASRLIDRVVVSTDDAEIAAVAKEHGAEVPFMRPPELAQDDSPEWLAWRHAIEALGLADSKNDRSVFVSVPPTSPLRSPEDVDSCVRALIETDADIVITVRPAERSPFFNMVTLDSEDNARLAVEPDKAIHRRQAAPPVYDMTTVAYAVRPKFVLEADSTFEGNVKAVVIPPERALDIDTEHDFHVAELLLRDKALSAE